jgi:hypothetical protein
MDRKGYQIHWKDGTVTKMVSDKIVTSKKEEYHREVFFCGGCDKQIPIVIGVNQLHICDCGTLNNIGDAE